MRSLKLWIGMGNQRTRLAQPKAQRTKESLALSHPQGNAELLLDPGRQGLPIPDSSRQMEVFWALAQGLRDLAELLLIEPFRPTRPIPVGQASQTFLFKPTNPVLDSARRIAKQVGHLTATHAMGNQQQSMKAVIVSCLPRAADLVLQGQDHRLGIWNPEFSHVARLPRVPVMRNYL